MADTLVIVIFSSEISTFVIPISLLIFSLILHFLGFLSFFVQDFL